VRASEAAVGPVREALTSEIDRAGKKLLDEHASDQHNLTFEAVQAGAAHGVIDRTKEEGRDYDLVVMGSHGRRGFRRFILGSVAETVVRHAPCSVLVVHREEE
jgi:nucleotide-binding universal stress UspA family protein